MNICLTIFIFILKLITTLISHHLQIFDEYEYEFVSRLHGNKLYLSKYLLNVFKNKIKNKVKEKKLSKCNVKRT